MKICKICWRRLLSYKTDDEGCRTIGRVDLEKDCVWVWFFTEDSGVFGISGARSRLFFSCNRYNEMEYEGSCAR